MPGTRLDLAARTSETSGPRGRDFKGARIQKAPEISSTSSQAGTAATGQGAGVSKQRAAVLRWEVWIVWALGALALMSIPLAQGQSGLIWDALNHHIYLGWMAGTNRFDRDFFAAGWQSHQYPYLYWPAYKLAMAGFSGAAAGAVLALLQSLAVPPVWLVARNLCPGERAEDIAMRWLAVALALSGGVTLSLVDTTSNDVLAGIPLLWAIALAFLANDDGDRSSRERLRLVLWSGLLAGVSVAFKLSNGPLAIVMPVLWLMGPGGMRAVMTRVVVACVATLIGFVMAYAPWGWQLWKYFGNPVYPLFGGFFDSFGGGLLWHKP